MLDLPILSSRPGPVSVSVPVPVPCSVRRGGRALAVLLAAWVLVLTACGEPDPIPNLGNPGTTIVCLGDSITAGTGAPRGESYPEVLAHLVADEVINAGVPGDTSSAGRARLEAALAEDPWLVVIGLGGNDLLRRVPPEDTEAELDTIVRGVLDAGAIPLLLELDVPFGERYRDVYGRVAERHGVPLLEGVLGEVLRDPALKSDAVHPNAAGYRRLAEAVAERVRDLQAARRELGVEP